MKFQERHRFSELDAQGVDVEYVNVLQIESGYERNVLATLWDANPRRESAKIAVYLSRKRTPIQVIPGIKAPFDFTERELEDEIGPQGPPNPPGPPITPNVARTRKKK